MDTLLYYIGIPLGYLMKWCWQLVGNYGVAIILFTLATKIVLLPVSVWIQKNSILMVKIQPDVNRLKVRLYGNADAIAEEQTKLFKSAGYHPLLTLIPLIIQIVLLMGVVGVIYNPFECLFGYSGDTVRQIAHFLKISTAESGYQLSVIEAIKAGKLTASAAVSNVPPEILSGIIKAANNFDINFLGVNLTKVTTVAGGLYYLVPVVAGFSSWVLCYTQNLSNVIQHEQGKVNQIGLMLFSIALSLYLGAFVPAGIALYWVASNLFSVVQMYLLNIAINPKKYVDYKALEESRKELSEIENLDSADKNTADYKANKAREKKDYKRFMGIANKHIVFYSERSGFYKYYKDLIEELLRRSNLSIHYITNDPNDAVFELSEKEPRIKPYYMSVKKCITAFMFMEADMVIMTTPDLDKFYFKRSYVKKDIEYGYIPHDLMSIHYSFNEGAFDAFDTIFCTSEHVKEEIRATEKVYSLPEKTLVTFGYPLADNLREEGLKAQQKPKDTPLKRILIAPSWQQDNLLDSCIEDMINGLYCDEYEITVRPHPEYIKRYMPRLNSLMEQFKDKIGEKLKFELDFSSNRSVYESDILITDWSGISVEFCFATHRPVIFVNTEPKCENPNWQKIGIEPIDFTLRNEVGIALEKNEVKEKIKPCAQKLLENGEAYEKAIIKWYDKMVYNHGTAAEEGAKYILNSLKEKHKK